MEQLCDTSDVFRHLLSFISPNIFNDWIKSHIRPFNEAKQEIKNALYLSCTSKKIYNFFTSQTPFKDKNLLTLYIKKELLLIHDRITTNAVSWIFQIAFTYYPLTEEEYCLKYTVTTENAFPLHKNYYNNISKNQLPFIEYCTTYINKTTSDKKDTLNRWLEFFQDPSYSTFCQQNGATTHGKQLVLLNYFSPNCPLTYALFSKFIELRSIVRKSLQ